MKLILLYCRTSALIIIFSVITSIASAATIVSVATGNWSASAWPNTTVRPGTITTSAASPTVTGSAAALFLANISVGNVLYTTTGAVIGTVLSVNSNTSITLTANAASTNTAILYH